MGGRTDSRIPPEALEICAADLGGTPADLRVVSGLADGRHYKSRIYFLGSGDGDAPRYVVKIDADPYSPAHEQEALAFAARLFSEGDANETHDLSAVEPLGFGTSPNFLVTRHQAGALAADAVDRAATGWRTPRPMDDAHAQMRDMGRWLGVFRERAAREGGGLAPSSYLEEMRARVQALGSELNASRELALVLRHAERYVEQIDAADAERMAREYPNRGDARPKNFLVGDDGVLYALDMEGFGFGPMEHDLSCMHHALEYDGVRTAAAARRASQLWQSYWDEYAKHGSSRSFAFLGYLYFLVDKMRKSARLASRSGLRRKLELRFWLRGRMAWIAQLGGDLEHDADTLRTGL